MSAVLRYHQPRTMSGQRAVLCGAISLIEHLPSHGALTVIVEHAREDATVAGRALTALDAAGGSRAGAIGLLVLQMEGLS